VAAFVTNDPDAAPMCLDCFADGYALEHQSEIVPSIHLPLLQRVIDIIDTTPVINFDIRELAKSCNAPDVIDAGGFMDIPKLTASQVEAELDKYCQLNFEMDPQKYQLYNVTPKTTGVRDNGTLLKMLRFISSNFFTGYGSQPSRQIACQCAC